MTITELNAGDSSRASHVWRVDGPAGPEIVRRAWWTSPEVSAFMLGLAKLFGVDPRDLNATAEAYRFWRGLDVWAVPQPLGLRDFRGAPALRVEYVPGDSGTFGELTGAHARRLGQQVAQVHGRVAGTYGEVSGRTQQPLADFYPDALRMVREVAPRFAPEHWAAHWPEVERTFALAPAPGHAVPTLLDWNGAQFVWRGGQPSALVDVEASAFAPPELDLCFWEVLLTAAQAQAFRAGYTGVRPWPDLRPHRAACRLILLALESEGSVPLREWLALPERFGQDEG